MIRESELTLDDLLNSCAIVDKEPEEETKQVVTKEGPFYKEIIRLQNTIATLKRLNQSNSVISANEKLNCLVDMEYVTDTIRRTPAKNESVNKDISIEGLELTWSKQFRYYVERDEYGIKMVIPPVLMERSKKKATEKEKVAEREYAMSQVKLFLLNEKRKQGITDTNLTDQVLVFTHERIEESFFDIDNLSTSYYINAIADVFLAGDTAMNLDVMQRFIRGEENRTICYLIPRGDFSKWAKGRY